MTTAPATTDTKPRFKTNALALSSLVLAIVWFLLIPVVGDIMDRRLLAPVLRIFIALLGFAVAIVLGKLAQRQLERNPNQTGGTYAAAAIVVSWLGVVVALCVEYWFLLPDHAPAPE